MKQLFFTAAAIAIPGTIFLWIFWLFVKGVYSVLSDWQLERELNQIRRESKLRRQGGGSSASPDTKAASPNESPSFALDAASEPQTHSKLTDDIPPAD